MTAPAASPVRGARRAMIVAVVASLLVASLCGIVALLGGGFGDLQARIVATTLIVAAFGTSALCHLAVVTRAVRALGFAGLAASVVAAGAALWLVWGGDGLFEGDGDGSVLKTLLVATIVAISLAHANLLLLLAERRRTVIRAGLGLTLAAIAVVATMLALPVITDGAVGDREWYWRWFGVAGIVDALGTIALPVLALVLRGRRHEPAATEPAATELAPTEPAPTEPAPTEPAATEPASAGTQPASAGAATEAVSSGTASAGSTSPGPASAGNTATRAATAGTASAGARADGEATTAPTAAVVGSDGAGGDDAGTPSAESDVAPVRIVLDLPADLVARLDAAADGQARDAAALRVLRNALAQG
ncbi:hypothetical protein [Pseudonocardia sp. ICBG601]|uniref:hypothetical protein n=1 Tax=Pseudonocardia sp. ICBG601 TaxID=2846759 RepID=UPI001CF6D376|nr:hypothetical protein [Pseudonocardia sp. ICBG601]